jgi:hypothetical protein
MRFVLMFLIIFSNSVFAGTDAMGNFVTTSDDPQPDADPTLQKGLTEACNSAPTHILEGRKYSAQSQYTEQCQAQIEKSWMACHSDDVNFFNNPANRKVVDASQDNVGGLLGPKQKAINAYTAGGKQSVARAGSCVDEKKKVDQVCPAGVDQAREAFAQNSKAIDDTQKSIESTESTDPALSGLIQRKQQLSNETVRLQQEFLATESTYRSGSLAMVEQANCYTNQGTIYADAASKLSATLPGISVSDDGTLTEATEIKDLKEDAGAAGGAMLPNAADQALTRTVATSPSKVITSTVWNGIKSSIVGEAGTAVDTTVGSAVWAGARTGVYYVPVVGVGMAVIGSTGATGTCDQNFNADPVYAYNHNCAVDTNEAIRILNSN